MLRTRFAAKLLATCLLTVVTHGQVVLSNLGTATLDDDVVSEVSYLAQAFETPSGGTWTVNSVTLSMAVAAPGSNFIIGIHSDFAGGPGSLLTFGLLSGTDNPASAGNHTFLASDLVLDPGTAYWLVVGVDSGVSQFYWNLASGSSYQTSVWVPSNGQGFSDDEGVTWAWDGYPNPYKFSIDATPIPEPGTYAAWAGGMLLAFALWRRRTTAPAA